MPRSIRNPLFYSVLSSSILAASILNAASTITVRQDGLGDYLTIGGALDASAEADTVLVSPGTYYESARLVQHSVALLSTGGSGATIIDGFFLNRMFRWANLIFKLKFVR